MNIWQWLLKVSGWSTDITVPYRAKAVICVAPHTSNWDFIAGLIAYRSVGRKASFLMKKFWFFFPLKYILKALGGIPVPQKGNKKEERNSTSNQDKSGSLTAAIVEDFKRLPSLNLAVTPEGSRSPVENWRTGFLTIAYKANVPIQLGVIDFKNKKVIIQREFITTGDFRKDLIDIRKYYSNFKEAAKYPEKFIP